MADNAILHGFLDFRHQMADTITTIGVEKVMTAIEKAFAEHSRVLDGLMREFVEVTTDYQRAWKQPRARTLQPFDEKGMALPARGLREYTIAFPIQGGADQYGLTRFTSVTMTLADLQAEIKSMMDADNDWLLRHMLLPLFNPNEWTFIDDLRGSLTIKGLANTDGTLYLKRDGTFGEAQMYTHQNSIIDDADNPFKTIRENLKTYAVNNEPGLTLVCYINHDERADTEALTTFVAPPDLNVIVSANSDRVVNGVDVGWGEELVGYVKGAGAWVVESSRVPSGYVLGTLRGAKSAPVVMREFDHELLRGFRREVHVTDNKLQQITGWRFAGFGAHNRIGAHVVKVEEATAYDVPTGYASPPIN